MSEPGNPQVRVLTEQAVMGLALGITVALRDIHRLLIDRGVQTSEEAIARLELHIAELLPDGRQPTAMIVLKLLQLGLKLPATSLADLATSQPKGSA